MKYNKFKNKIYKMIFNGSSDIIESSIEKLYNKIFHKNYFTNEIITNKDLKDFEYFCTSCKKKLTLVRPGKYQCDNPKCENNSNWNIISGEIKI